MVRTIPPRGLVENRAMPAALPSPAVALLPAFALMFNAFVWGVSWWPFRRLEAAGLHPLLATVLVYVVAVAAIGLVKRAAWREVLRTPALWVVALASGTTNAAFNWGVTIGDVVRVVLLFYLMPLWAVLLARVLLGERLTAAAGARIGVALAGAAIVLWPEGGGWPVPRDTAEALGVVGGFSFALNNVMLRREAARGDSARALAMFTGGVVVAGAAAAGLWVQGAVPPLPAPAPMWVGGALALAGVFLLSNLALQYGATRLPANATAVIMITEVLFATASALALDGGRLTPQVALGGALILAAALLAAWRR
jgi:drug/metabolite transporter (DMT)-like permease